MLTTKQVADRLGVSRQAVQRAILRGTMKAEHFGRALAIEENEVERYRECYLRKPGRK